MLYTLMCDMTLLDSQKAVQVLVHYLQCQKPGESTARYREPTSEEGQP